MHNCTHIMGNAYSFSFCWNSKLWSSGILFSLWPNDNRKVCGTVIEFIEFSSHIWKDMYGFFCWKYLKQYVFLMSIFFNLYEGNERFTLKPKKDTTVVFFRMELKSLLLKVRQIWKILKILTRLTLSKLVRKCFHVFKMHFKWSYIETREITIFCYK